MARFSPDHVREISEKAWIRKDHYRELLSECYEFALPERNPYWNTGSGVPQGKGNTPGKDKSSRRVFDSTLQTDAIKITNRIQFELFPIGHEWAKFTPGTFVNDKQKDQALADLHSLQKIVFTAIGVSNFDLTISEWLLELVVAGMAAMFVVDGDEDEPIVFQAVSQAHVAVREGALGKIDLISRKHRMRCSLIDQTWTDAKLDFTEDELKDDGELDLIDVCYYSKKDRTWFYDVIIMGSGKQSENKRIVTREYDINPWIIARWIKAPEEEQGRSLVMQALPDARVLSSVKSYILKQAALSISGVWMMKNDAGMNANNIKIFPGAVIPVSSTGGPAGASIEPLRHNSDINLGDLITKDLVQSIHQIMMNTGMPDVSEGVRTATELIERMKELQQDLGAPFARILKEGIIPMLEAAISVLAKQGVIPVEPGRRIKLNKGQIDVKFASPLVQGQSVREVETLRNAMGITKEIAGEEATGLSFKVEDAGAWIGERMGVDPKMMRTQAERTKLQQDAAQVMGAQMGQPPQVGGSVGVNPAQQQQQADQLPLAA